MGSSVDLWRFTLENHNRKYMSETPKEPTDKNHTTRHLYDPGYRLEVGCTRLGWPSYRWVQAWVEALENGCSSIACTMANWRGMARRDEDTLVFHYGKDVRRFEKIGRFVNSFDVATSGDPLQCAEKPLGLALWGLPFNTRGILWSDYMGRFPKTRHSSRCLRPPQGWVRIGTSKALGLSGLRSKTVTLQRCS